MAKTLYYIREKATGKIIQCDWQNAFELVNHGFWEWAKGDGTKEFRRAQVEARRSNTPPAGFYEPVEDEIPEDDEDDVDVTPVVTPPVVVAPPTIDDVVKTDVSIESADDIEDMTKEELIAYADTKLGLKLDGRLGQKNMISTIRAHEEEAK